MGSRREARREHLITKMAGTNYDASATCPQWDAFLSYIMDGDCDLIAYLQRAVGYSITGDVSEQCLFICYGNGQNGKTVFLNTIQGVLGDYAVKASSDLLRRDKQDIYNPTTRASLLGRRFVVAVELARGEHLDKPLVKELTGGDIINARRMRQDEWTFTPTHKL